MAQREILRLKRLLIEAVAHPPRGNFCLGVLSGWLLEREPLEQIRAKTIPRRRDWPERRLSELKALLFKCAISPPGNDEDLGSIAEWTLRCWLIRTA